MFADKTQGLSNLSVHQSLLEGWFQQSLQGTRPEFLIIRSGVMPKNFLSNMLPTMLDATGLGPHSERN